MAELNAVLADGYDRELFGRALDRDRGLRELCERLDRILPHGEALLGDVFCALFKLNVVLRPTKTLSPAVLINRRIMALLIRCGDLDALRVRTELDGVNAVTATVILGERVLAALKREFRQDADKLLHAAESARDEEALEDRQAVLEHLNAVRGLDRATKAELATELEDEIRALQSKLERDRRRQGAAARIAQRIDETVQTEIRRLPEQLDEAESHARNLGLSAESRVDGARRLELGKRIMNSRKLVLLARLVGAFREVAFEARRRRVVRSPQTLHAVELGAALEHVLPSELVGIGASTGGRIGRARRVDFRRRLVERQLLQYRLESAAGRGAIVVCLDGSGSMQGSKEIWGKAVALTLMEIARRERRRCLAIIFSSGQPPFEVELLATRGGGRRAHVVDEAVLRFAEHFPGGGTDFEPPLERAVSAVTTGNQRRGDIVFITDGQASVSDALAARIKQVRRQHRFKIRAILVDVAGHERSTVEHFADDVRTVTELAADSLEDLFAAV